MTYEESQSEKLEKCLEMVKKAIGERFQIEEINGETWYHEGEMLWFRPWALWFEDPYDYAIVLEYADSRDKIFLAEDGNCFYISDMTEEELVNAVLEDTEIEIKRSKVEVNGEK